MRKGKTPQGYPTTRWWRRSDHGDVQDYPLAYPPDLRSHAGLEVGDLFVHRSRAGIQLWLWSETERWTAVLLGHRRL